MDFQLPQLDLGMMLPEMILFVWALGIIAYDFITKRRSGATIGYLAMAGLVVSGVFLSINGYGAGFGTMFFNDGVAVFFKVIFLVAAFMAIGSSFELTKEKIVNHRGEFFGLILLSTVGMMFLSSANELLSLYIGLELTTIPLFVLAAFFKDNKLSVEAGIKYFIIGAFSSALLLYGLSFLYGLAGTTDLTQLKINLALTFLTFEGIGYILIIAIVLTLAGIGFKLSLPPFHQWAPDVYEGAPTPVAAFLSVGSKGAGVVAFAKIFVNGLFGFHGPEMVPNDWGQLAALIAVLAMIIGNVTAIRQTNIKRMLAYSSIAQAGYIMIGIIVLSGMGMASVGYYMFVYMFANLGAFAIVAMVEDKTGSCQIESYSGLSRTSPFLAASMSIFLLSLVGIPPLAGFFAKYYVFAAAIQAAQTAPDGGWIYWVVGIGLLTAVFSLYYYANVIKKMYFASEPAPFKVRLSPTISLVVAIGLAGVIMFGLYPEPVLKAAGDISLAFGFYPIH